MTTPITYPPTVKTWGINQALTNQSTWISYVGVDGSIFYLAGPLAPVAGAQEGLILKKFMGLMSPFENLELHGARQDGATWTDAVYDSGEIMLSVEASGLGPQSIRDVLRQWISAWDPKQIGILSVFTPDMGEWWANVRLSKNVSDAFVKDYTWSGRQELTWSCKNYDAYWYSVDSTSTFAIAYDHESENFTKEANASTLDVTKWTQNYTPAEGFGTCGIKDGAAVWIPNGVVNETVQNLYVNDSATDSQVVSVTLSGATWANLFSIFDEGAFFDLWARVSSDGQTGIRCRIGFETATLSYFIDGTAHNWFTIPLIIPPLWGETFTLLVGTETGLNNIRILRDGFTMHNFTDSANASSMGSDCRGWGFGMATHANGSSLAVPPPIQSWSAADNLQLTQSGYCPLTNRGDVEAWPRYLCYGPGTFAFSNGVGSQDFITFGPLEDGQVVLVTTEPRLRSVVDLTPNQAPAAQQNIWQQLLAELISFATNNNVPPFLQQFESFFGIVPPQGNLYSMLKGRFTNPIPASTYGVQPPTNRIAVSITDGSPISRVVAAITPRRRWPL